MRDELTGEHYAYTGHREELIHSEIALPDATPQWLRTLVDGRTPAQASAALWNKVQAEGHAGECDLCPRDRHRAAGGAEPGAAGRTDARLRAYSFPDPRHGGGLGDSR